PTPFCQQHIISSIVVMGGEAAQEPAPDAKQQNVQATLEKYRQRRRQIEMEEQEKQQAQALAVLAEDASLVTAGSGASNSRGYADSRGRAHSKESAQASLSLLSESAAEYIPARQRRMARLEQIQRSLHGAGSDDDRNERGVDEEQHNHNRIRYKKDSGTDGNGDSDSDGASASGDDTGQDKSGKDTSATQSVFPGASQKKSL
ncbi:hypothetical protein LPJ57_009182, partial [Coemansia sp. RSA 486]